MKQCRTCEKEFEPTFNTTQSTCSWQCALALAKTKNGKKRKKAFNAETRRRKDAAKSRSDRIREAQAAFNAYIRSRDAGNGCISCDKPATWRGQWHASHYRPSGNNSALRFHEMNVHKACSICNNHKSGNLTDYRINLIHKIGEDNVNWLEMNNEPYKWEIDDLIEIKQHYREKGKCLN